MRRITVTLLPDEPELGFREEVEPEIETMQLPPRQNLEELEEQVQRSLRTLDMGDFDILGYGEVTTVFRLETTEGAFACKRFPVFREAHAAESHIALIREYIAALSSRGIRVLDSDFVSLQAPHGGLVLYLVQPILDPASLGTNYFRTLSIPEAAERYSAILRLLKDVVSERLAPDGQLSNWAFDLEGLTYLDVSTPFMRDEAGRERTDWMTLSESVISGLLRPLRSYYASKIPETVAFYYSLRGQALDFLGNLRKEKLDRLIESFLPLANETLELEQPISMQDVRNYYNQNADFYALLMKLFRANRGFHRHILRKTYPNFIPPHIERNKFQRES